MFLLSTLENHRCDDCWLGQRIRIDQEVNTPQGAVWLMGCEPMHLLPVFQEDDSERHWVGFLGGLWTEWSPCSHSCVFSLFSSFLSLPLCLFLPKITSQIIYLHTSPGVKLFLQGNPSWDQECVKNTTCPQGCSKWKCALLTRWMRAAA